MAFLFLAVSCWESQELRDAKAELLNNQTPSEERTTAESEITSNSSIRSENTLISWENVQIIPQTTEQYLDFDSISEADIADGEVVISGSADSSVEKIQVLFSNSDSDFPDDNYTLQTYTPESESFRYIASSKNQVLDFGKNTYTFRAYSGKEYTETDVILIHSKSEEISGTETRLIGGEDNTLFIDLPKSSEYGEPVQLGESSFTYSGIKWLEVSRELIPDVSCETLTDFLTERLNTWYYWNTCRDLIQNDAIYYNVISLSGEEYIYERHYIDFQNGLYATYELERGTGVDSENIADKNTELKEVAYETTTIVDGLIRDIIQN